MKAKLSLAVLFFLIDWFYFFTCHCCCHFCFLLSIESSQLPVCLKSADLDIWPQHGYVQTTLLDTKPGSEIASGFLTVQLGRRSCRREDVRSCRTWGTREQHSSCDVFKTNNPLRRTVNIQDRSAETTLPCAALGRVAASHNNYHLTAQKTEEQTQTSMKNVFQEVKSL